MTWQAWFTLGVLALVFLSLAFTRVGPDAILCGGLTLLMLFGVVSTKSALAGFGNEAVITVAALFVVAGALTETGAISLFAGRWLGRPKTAFSAQLRIMGPIAALSGFMNNTPLVAIMMPEVNELSKRSGISPSKLMIPLSYAAILGGTITLIGTSTNLVVDGLMRESGHPGLSLFAITPVGLPCAIAGLAFIVVVGVRLLPDRKAAISITDDPREYTVEMTVPGGSPLAGQTVEGAGLRHLPGVFLIEIERGGEILAAPGPESRLLEGDRLVFAGVVESVVDLRKIRGLEPATDQIFKLDAPRQQRRLIEVVVASQCPVVGRTIREGRFRHHYDAAVIAVARDGRRIQKKIGDIELEAGDTLLLEARSDFAERHRNSRDFILVSALDGSTPPRHDKAWIALGILLSLVVTASLGFLDIVKAAFLASGLLLATRCISAREARRSVDWSTLVAIAASFGIGQALKETGAAKAIADACMGLAGGESPWAALAMIYLITLVATEVITNNAAAALVFPIAMATADRLGASSLPFAIAVMIAASAGFATPIGYQTNLMVYGPGGYRFSDYAKIGVPLDIVIGIVAVGLIPVFFPFGG